MSTPNEELKQRQKTALFRLTLAGIPIALLIVFLAMFNIVNIETMKFLSYLYVVGMAASTLIVYIFFALKNRKSKNQH
jgi:hypothetical protein